MWALLGFVFRFFSGGINAAEVVVGEAEEVMVAEVGKVSGCNALIVVGFGLCCSSASISRLSCCCVGCPFAFFTGGCVCFAIEELSRLRPFAMFVVERKSVEESW